VKSHSLIFQTAEEKQLLKCKVLSSPLYVHKTSFVPHSNVRTLKAAHQDADLCQILSLLWLPCILLTRRSLKGWQVFQCAMPWNSFFNFLLSVLELLWCLLCFCWLLLNYSHFWGLSSSNTSDYMIVFTCSFIDSPSSKVLLCKETGTNDWKIIWKGRDHSDGDMSYREFMSSCSDVKAAVPPGEPVNSPTTWSPIPSYWDLLRVKYYWPGLSSVPYKHTLVMSMVTRYCSFSSCFLLNTLKSKRE